METKKFAEYKGLDLCDVNQEVLARWQELDIFHRSITAREGAPQLFFMKVHLCKRTSRHSSRIRSFYQRRILSLQNHEGLSGSS